MAVDDPRGFGRDQDVRQEVADVPAPTPGSCIAETSGLAQSMK
jgi:hypothetical protein